MTKLKTKIKKITWKPEQKEVCKCPLCCAASDAIVKMLREFKGVGPEAKHPDAYVFYFAAMSDPELTFPEFKQAIELLEEDGTINYDREEGEIWLSDNKYHSFTSVN